MPWKYWFLQWGQIDPMVLLGWFLVMVHDNEYPNSYWEALMTHRMWPTNEKHGLSMQKIEYQLVWRISCRMRRPTNIQTSSDFNHWATAVSDGLQSILHQDLGVFISLYMLIVYNNGNRMLLLSLTCIYNTHIYFLWLRKESKSLSPSVSTWNYIYLTIG